MFYFNQTLYSSAGETRMKYGIAHLFNGIASLLLGGCATYHVYQVGGPEGRELGNQPMTEWKEKTLNSFLWGSVRQDIPVEDCRLQDGTRTGIEEVRIRTNFGYTIVTVATLGFWTPIDVGWRCAKPPGARGTLDRTT